MATTPDLDNLAVYPALDPAGVREQLHSLPRQCHEAWQQALATQLPRTFKDCTMIVIGGMGGSAIAGDLLADLAAEQGAVPVVVVRDFHIPFPLGKGSLVIACSHSGKTEETLSVFRQALAMNAKLLTVTSGGLLAQQAKAQGIPLLRISARGAPRSAIGSNLMILLGVLYQLGSLHGKLEDVQTALTLFQQQAGALGEGVPIRDNPAKQLALELRGKLIVMYGGGIFSGLARRWKSQFNENAKTWAFFELLPEALHNAVEAYGMPPEISQRTTAILLQPRAAEHLVQRFQTLSELLRQGGVAHHTLIGVSGPPLTQLLSMLLFGDYTSYYLALLNGADPSPTPAIAFAKEHLSISPAQRLDRNS